MRLSASRIQCFQRCPRRYYWRYVERLVSPEPAAAPTFGVAIHAALAAWYETHDQNKVVDVFMSKWQDRPGDDKHTLAVGAQMLGSYIKRYTPEPFEVLSLERPFAVHVGEHELAVRIDLAVRWGERIYVVDHKTTSRLGFNFFSGFKPNVQTAAYTYAAKKLFADYPWPVMGVIINALLVAKTKNEFARHPVHYNDRELRAFEEVVERSAEALDPLLAIGTVDVFEPRWAACSDWGGCQYRELCLAHMEGGDDAVARMRDQYMSAEEQEDYEEGELID